MGPAKIMVASFLRRQSGRRGNGDPPRDLGKRQISASSERLGPSRPDNLNAQHDSIDDKNDAYCGKKKYPHATDVKYSIRVTDEIIAGDWLLGTKQSSENEK